MRALVIGANGFAGAYLMKELAANGYDVVGADVFASEGDNIVKVDMLSEDDSFALIRNTMPDVIFNLAGQAAPSIAWEKINLTMHLNVDISVNIANAVAKLCPACKILLIGSANQYDGFSAPGGLISEETRLNNSNPYDVSKNTQEALMRIMAERYGLNIMMTRSFNHIGAGQKTGFVITDYASRIVSLENGKIDTFSFGNLDSWRDFSDVRDVVRAYRLIAERGKAGEIYNVGSGKSFYVRDLVGHLVELSDKAKASVTLPPRKAPEELTHIRADISKLTRDTGFVPECDINETLKEVLTYYRKLG